MKYTRLAISCDRLAAVCRGLLRRWGEIGGEFRGNEPEILDFKFEDDPTLSLCMGVLFILKK